MLPRFAYEEAQAIIETETNNIPTEVSLTGKSYKADQAVADAVLKMNELGRQGIQNTGLIKMLKKRENYFIS